MEQKVIQNLEDFLNDFQYFKVEGYNAFRNSFDVGSKLVVINSTPYQDGLMLEIQLAIKIDQVEELMLSFHQQEISKLSLSYWKSLAQISTDTPKRNFIQNDIELKKILSELEGALVKKGFLWLDEFSDRITLSNHLIDLVFYCSQKPPNLYKLCQRSYLLRSILGEKMTDAVFYEYYEQLQFYKVPEHQLEEFLDFKNYLKVQFN